MQIKAFLKGIFKNIISIVYLLPDKNALQGSDKDSLTMGWMIQHMGSRGNYPNYKFDDSTPDYTIDGYTLEQIQLVIRHGTRYPVISGMESINNALFTLNQSSNWDLVGWLNGYKNEYLFSRTGQLDVNGQQEEYLIGRRFAKTYPQFTRSLIDSDFTISSQWLRVSSSWSSRTLQSAQAFCVGAFEGLGTVGPTNLMTVPVFSFKENNDSLIAFHKSCPRWQKEAKPLTNQILEPVIQRLVSPIASRLARELGITITVTDVQDFHDACTSEVSLHHTIDTFCRLFSRQDVVALEYLDDLKHYYKYSYGLPALNEKMACDLGKYIVASINAMIDKKEDTFKLDVKFGHSETLLPLRTLLGLYQEKLSPNSSNQEIEDRQFKLSNFGYFANNIAIQLLSKEGKFYVRILDNEKPILLPGCQSIHCPIDRFRKVMSLKTQCNFVEFCRVDVI
ncbi:multiple inositol polyphosphate phosphatase 1-like isoform 2 [Mucor ambiguus]|uniref:Multiple inositol polyphosphate phosphatase 1 n=1 Tax=Mucor ambiguus TaxID=91626 RepID=A0A0C9LZJ4_9FUNG|nr:multiple inositol polyphosphate phosphatase 1-like isoform 2 [Mucor ambiguus]